MTRRASSVILAMLATLGVPGDAWAQKRAVRTDTVPGPAESFVHEAWTVRDGMPVNSVTSVIQTRDGYIWIATFDGLVRFDGIRFTVFNSGNSPGLTSNRIVRLTEGGDGSLWLQGEQPELVRYRDGVFTQFGPSRGMLDHTRNLYRDRHGTLWVSTSGGLGRIAGERFVAVGAGVITRPAPALVERADGSMWAGTSAGRLFRIVGDVVTPVAHDSLPAGVGITALHEDPHGTLWVGTSAGVWRLFPRLEHVLRIGTVLSMQTSPRTGDLWVSAPRGVYRIGAHGVDTMVTRTNASLTATTMLADGEGRMVYTAGPEIHRDGRPIFVLPRLRPDDPREPNGIGPIAMDADGSLWLGTPGAGLRRIKPSTFTVYSEAEGLSSRNVYSVYEDRARTVWVGTLGGGSNRIVGGRVVPVPIPVHPGDVFSYLEDRTGRLWVGSGAGRGLLVCAPGGLRCAAVSPDVIGRSRTLALHEDPDGGVWVGAEAGLFRRDAHGWHRFTPAEGAPVYPVRAFERTRDGALWMGTGGGGLARYANGRLTSVTMADGLPLDLVRSLHADADGQLWIGTEGRGLARLDPRDWADGRRGGRIVSYRMKDGLFDEMIHQILEDDFGRLWMSTNRGIFWVARAELDAFAAGRAARIHSTAYTERDGLRNREGNGGSQPVGIRAHDGRLWFATQDGVVVVDPASIQRTRAPPKVVIEQVIAGGAPQPARVRALSLGTEQRDLRIEYTALSFLAPNNVRFRHRLDPYDADWVDAGDRRAATYTRVPPGRYTFRVQASGSDGIWNAPGAAVRLEIAPYFRETLAARVLLAVVVLLALAGGFGWRVRILRSRTRELARLVDERTQELRAQRAQLVAQAGQLQELDRAKSRFFANVSHEFRTPLTLTIGPLEDLRARLEAPGGELTRHDAPRQLDMALRNARRLLRLVNQVLDVAKLEAGQMKLRAQRTDLVAFTRGVTAAFAPVAERKRLSLAVTAPAAIDVWFDADAMEKVLANLLSNALKFTPDGGRIDVAVHAEPGRGEAGVVRVSVGDSGPGIPPEHLPHVFERFYQVDETSTRAQAGTGIGLALTKELVELHGGTITVRTGTADGTPAGATFIVTLPLGREHLRDDQIAAAPGDARGSDDGAPATSDRRATTIDTTIDPTVRASADGADAGEDVTTILVVDDSADLRAWMRAHFESRYRVVEAADGAEGIARARALVPDLVISDVMMPVTDGYALCRALKGSAETDFIPVVLLTARATTDDRVTGLEGGADAYLVKPFEMRELEARVENLIVSRRRLRERFSHEPVARADPASVVTPSSPDQAWVERLRAAIDARLAEPDFGVAELADAMFMDRTHLFRRARELLGASPSELIRRQRLERAASLLAGGSDGVGEVAYGVGFNSVSHFCRAFREAYGASPSEYREARAARR